MAHYDQIVSNTIRKNNHDIYNELKSFLSPDLSETNSQNSFEKHGLRVRGVGGSSGGQQIPCSLIITSNESASSIDT